MGYTPTSGYTPGGGGGEGGGKHPPKFLHRCKCSGVNTHPLQNLVYTFSSFFKFFKYFFNRERYDSVGALKFETQHKLYKHSQINFV